MRPTDKATADSRSVQSFAIIENTGQRNFVIGGFHTRAEMDYLSETGLCTVSPFPTDTLSPAVASKCFLRYRGGIFL